MNARWPAYLVCLGLCGSLFLKDRAAGAAQPGPPAPHPVVRSTDPVSVRFSSLTAKRPWPPFWLWANRRLEPREKPSGKGYEISGETMARFHGWIREAVAADRVEAKPFRFDERIGEDRFVEVSLSTRAPAGLLRKLTAHLRAEPPKRRPSAELMQELQELTTVLLRRDEGPGTRSEG